ncbi:hypothetical protein E2C01_022282 [Portunus trituberculatus]|uniref:Uncharacterized protein n=1 Tax=Portunus trituberculatus TaxID=210409 RepID=A0A5B7E8H4_PORTR|nr:hypothetical protein [Portunus trituberculatus]
MRSRTSNSPSPQGTTTRTDPKHTVTFISLVLLLAACTSSATLQALVALSRPVRHSSGVLLRMASGKLPGSAMFTLPAGISSPRQPPAHNHLFQSLSPTTMFDATSCLSLVLSMYSSLYAHFVKSRSGRRLLHTLKGIKRYTNPSRCCVTTEGQSRQTVDWRSGGRGGVPWRQH